MNHWVGIESLVRSGARWVQSRRNASISQYRNRPGYTLVEAIICIGLLGFLVSMLFFTYADFTRVITQARERFLVAHNSSQFMSRLALELSQTNRLLPSSNANEVYFSYYDPVKEEVSKIGYRLSANGANFKKLERMLYNDSNNTWVARSPYPGTIATIIAIENNAQFRYCADTPCTTPVAPEKALYVQLQQWMFYKSTKYGENYKLVMPEADEDADLNLYLGSGLTGDIILSETPRQLFSFAKNDSFGASSNLALTMLTPNGSELQNPSMGVAPSTGTLTTIVSNSTSVGKFATMVNPETGRVFFAEDDSFMTWNNGTLSTLVSGRNAPGVRSSALDAGRKRVFFGENDNSGNFYAWTEGGSLSTLATGLKKPGVNSTMVDTSSGRVYFGQDDGVNPVSLMQWDPPAGPAVPIVTGPRPGVNSMIVDTARGRLFFGESASPGNFYLWSGGVLSTLASGLNSPGEYAVAVNSATGRVYFGENSPTGKLYTWIDGDPTATAILPGNRAYPGHASLMVDPSRDRVYFGDSQNFYTWNPGTSLSTLVSGANWPGYYSSGIDPVTGNVYFGELATTGEFYTWNPTGSLSTIVTGRPDPGVGSVVVDPARNRVFFGEHTTTGNFYTWSAGTLSTILANESLPGYFSDVLNPATGAVYFSTTQGSGTGEYLSWNNGTLSTLVSNSTKAGFYARAVNPRTGQVFFGEDDPAGDFFSWMPNTQLASVLRVSSLGAPSSQTYNIQYFSDAYIGAAQDNLSDYYLLNSTGKTIDRFHFDKTNNVYSRLNRVSWAPFATQARAVTVDQSNKNVSILAQDLSTGNWEIETFSDRTLNGTPGASTDLLLNGVATTPTGLAINGKTGDFLVLDSSLQSGTSVRLFVISSAGVVKETIPINVTASNLTTAATGETNFKIAYNDQENLLYLIAPTIGQVYGISLSKYL